MIAKQTKIFIRVTLGEHGHDSESWGQKQALCDW